MAALCAGVISACSHGMKPAADLAPAPAMNSAMAAGPANPVLVAPSAAVLKPFKRTYVARIFSQGQAHRLGWRTLELSETTYDGKPAWLLAESRLINTLQLAESLYVAKGSLEPVHRVVHTADENITTHYTRDSIITSFEGDSGGNVRVAVKNERDLIGNIYWIEPLLASLPLALGYKGSATTEFVGPHDQAHVELKLWVTGQDSILVPNGSFEAWTLTLQVGDTQEHLWVRKSDKVLLKMDTPVSGIAAAKVELLLGEGQAPQP
ncbi:MAG: hypothetical protein ABI446_10915 [Gemmatimonadaceae bacterium]